MNRLLFVLAFVVGGFGCGSTKPLTLAQSDDKSQMSFVRGGETVTLELVRAPKSQVPGNQEEGGRGPLASAGAALAVAAISGVVSTAVDEFNVYLTDLSERYIQTWGGTVTVFDFEPKIVGSPDDEKGKQDDKMVEVSRYGAIHLTRHVAEELPIAKPTDNAVDTDGNAKSEDPYEIEFKAVSRLAFGLDYDDSEAAFRLRLSHLEIQRAAALLHDEDEDFKVGVGVKVFGLNVSEKGKPSVPQELAAFDFNDISVRLGRRYAFSASKTPKVTFDPTSTDLLDLLPGENKAGPAQHTSPLIAIPKGGNLMFQFVVKEHDPSKAGQVLARLAKESSERLKEPATNLVVQLSGLGEATTKVQAAGDGPKNDGAGELGSNTGKAEENDPVEEG